MNIMRSKKVLRTWKKNLGKKQLEVKDQSSLDQNIGRSNLNKDDDKIEKKSGLSMDQEEEAQVQQSPKEQQQDQKDEEEVFENTKEELLGDKEQNHKNGGNITENKERLHEIAPQENSNKEIQVEEGEMQDELAIEQECKKKIRKTKDVVRN